MNIVDTRDYSLNPEKDNYIGKILKENVKPNTNEVVVSAEIYFMLMEFMELKPGGDEEVISFEGLNIQKVIPVVLVYENDKYKRMIGYQGNLEIHSLFNYIILPKRAEKPKEGEIITALEERAKAPKIYIKEIINTKEN